MTAANGDTLDWTGAFEIWPLGEIRATLTLHGGTGRFLHADGTASGPVVLDPDFMFTLNLEGELRYVDLG